MKVVLVSLLLLACDSDDGEEPGPGSLGFECYVNLTCNPGLECVERLCAPGADVVETRGDVGDAETSGPLDTATETGPDTALDTGDPHDTTNQMDTTSPFDF